jgi:hypothetical protein
MLFAARRTGGVLNCGLFCKDFIGEEEHSDDVWKSVILHYGEEGSSEDFQTILSRCDGQGVYGIWPHKKTIVLISFSRRDWEQVPLSSFAKQKRRISTTLSK